MPVTKASLRPWLLLVFSLPKKGASVRVKVWRKLKRFGALPLGNSGYLVPNGPENRERFELLATIIRSQRGEASVLEVQSMDNYSAHQLKQRFAEARHDDYQILLDEIRKVSGTSSARGRVTRIRQRFHEIVSIDFLSSPLRVQVERAVNSLEKQKVKESHFELGTISRAAYRNRVWVTRANPGVDRVMSAWLIRNLIDPKAKFVFASEGKKPTNAVPFDMYEGGFGHRGEDCTFETLLKVFRIREKRAGVMGQIVHDADLFDEKFGRKEGFGVDEIMKGWARQGLDNQELLARGMQLAEGLYRSLR